MLDSKENKITETMRVDKNILKVYHGTISDKFTVPDVTISSPRRDFSRGFYVTKNPEQAKIWAQEMADKENSKVDRSAFEGDIKPIGIATPYVLHYDFNKNVKSDSRYNYMEFEETTAQWAFFVAQCRTECINFSRPNHAYDVVEGPLADNQVTDECLKFISNGKDKLIDLANTIKKIVDEKGNEINGKSHQISIHNQKVVSEYLSFKKREVIECLVSAI